MNRPVSQALPGFAYGDPAKIVEAQEIRKKGCSVCVRAEYIFGLPVCKSNLKFPACRQDRKNGHQLTPEAGG
ncbi:MULTISPECIES: hypothetical protein [unclassified Pseudomonas]|uniref:hypothetical protein n=1 Tax=unclassified Pseudomonas TaxID=196821 RepID=UPI0011A44B92|nr:MULTISPECIES: hypothetical protein [unclassified Pseudomonas]